MWEYRTNKAKNFQWLIPIGKWNETHSAENTLLLQKSELEDNISWKFEDFTGAGV